MFSTFVALRGFQSRYWGGKGEDIIATLTGSGTISSFWTSIGRYVCCGRRECGISYSRYGMGEEVSLIDRYDRLEDDPTGLALNSHSIHSIHLSPRFLNFWKARQRGTIITA